MKQGHSYFIGLPVLPVDGELINQSLVEVAVDIELSDSEKLRVYLCCGVAAR